MASESSKTTKAAEVNNNNRKRKRVEFQYGNYRNYYNKRLGKGEIQTDLRLQIFEAHPEYFRDKTVLDIGCNSGFITINLAKRLLPASVVGLDIDQGLINKARSDLEKEKTDGDLSKQEMEALSRVYFRHANYILTDKTLLDREKPQYDVVLCLSITKWIHLNHGDEGIRFMFKRIYKQLKPNGILILEAQAFNSYKKRSKLSPEILENYRQINLKPDQFESLLLSDAIGFAEAWDISSAEQLEENVQAKGFRRTLQVFIKREQFR